MSANRGPPLLATRALTAGYGNRAVVRDISIHIEEGEIVAIIGHNGSGKSTLLKALFGLLPSIAGDIELRTSPTVSPHPRQMLRAGIAYMPQGQRVFDDLTVVENLQVAAQILSERLRRAKAVDEAFRLFADLERLRHRTCRNLSAGERQMVALASSLLTSPRLLLLDEPTIGLAPQPASHLLQRLSEINSKNGTAILIVEQRIKAVLSLSHRAYLMTDGAIAQLEGSPPDEALLPGNWGGRG